MTTIQQVSADLTSRFSGDFSGNFWEEQKFEIRYI